MLLALMAALRAGAVSQEAGKEHLKEHLSIWAVCPQELFEHLSSLLIKPKHLSWLGIPTVHWFMEDRSHFPELSA